jgi:hypothetical protein
MAFPEVEARITSPAELAQILREAKMCIARGVLRQVKPADAPFALDDLSAVPDEGPWPDYFEDPEGRRYKLTVETYHGAGGSWVRA